MAAQLAAGPSFEPSEISATICEVSEVLTVDRLALKADSSTLMVEALEDREAVVVDRALVSETTEVDMVL